jgi:hypothetical protein
VSRRGRRTDSQRGGGQQHMQTGPRGGQGRASRRRRGRIGEQTGSGVALPPHRHGRRTRLAHWWCGRTAAMSPSERFIRNCDSQRKSTDTAVSSRELPVAKRMSQKVILPAGGVEGRRRGQGAGRSEHSQRCGAGLRHLRLCGSAAQGAQPQVAHAQS